MTIKYLLPIFIILLTTNCSGRSEAPATLSVDKYFTIALFPEETSATDSQSAALLREKVHVTDLVRYPGEETVTMPFTFTDVKKYAGITGSNIGKRIAVSVNGEITSSPMVKMQIDNGACSVTLDSLHISRLFPEIKIATLLPLQK